MHQEAKFKIQKYLQIDERRMLQLYNLLTKIIIQKMIEHFNEVI